MFFLGNELEANMYPIGTVEEALFYHERFLQWLGFRIQFNIQKAAKCAGVFVILEIKWRKNLVSCLFWSLTIRGFLYAKDMLDRRVKVVKINPCNFSPYLLLLGRSLIVREILMQVKFYPQKRGYMLT